MNSEATKAFTMVLDNAEGIATEIRNEVYKLLGINTDSKQIEEYVKECLEKFSFNISEQKFLQQVRNIVNDEIVKISNIQNVDYQTFSNDLIEKLKSIKNTTISLDDDLKVLSNQMVSKFPYIQISSDQLYQHFVSRKEQIVNMINSHNQNIVDSLIKLTPKLAEELKSKREESKSNNIVPENKQVQPSVVADKPMSIVTEKVDDMSRIDGLINASKAKYNELQRRLSYLNSGNVHTYSKVMYEKGQLKRALLELSDFIEKLYAGKYAQELIGKFSNERDVNAMFEKIIHESVPQISQVNNLTTQVEEQYGKYAQVQYQQYEFPTIDIDKLHTMVVSSTKLKDLLKGKEFLESVLNTFDYDTNKKLKDEYDLLIDKIITISMKSTRSKTPNPEPSPNMNAEIGNSKSDVSYLINSNQYLSVLQAIPQAQADKYRDFIKLGLDTMLDKWMQEAKLCKTLAERDKSTREFAELYENFKDYLPMDISNMLRTNLEEMQQEIAREMAKQNAKGTMPDGIRYNSSQEEQKSMAAKR